MGAQGHQGEAARHQARGRQLDRNNELARETRDAVRDIERKLDETTRSGFVKVEADIDTLHVGRMTSTSGEPELSE